MNNDLISREALKKKLQARHDNGEEDFDKGYNIGIETAIDIIDNAPTVYPICEDKACKYRANERPQGEWKHLQAIGDYKCSICGCENLYKYANEHERWVKTNSNFCPNCGADMRKGANKEDKKV